MDITLDPSVTGAGTGAGGARGVAESVDLWEGIDRAAYRYGVRVEAWYGSRYLGEVPVESGSVAWSTSQQVQGKIQLTVPRLSRTAEGDLVDWLPASPYAPLACNGQELRAYARVESSVAATASFEVPLGIFVITSYDPDGTSISVTGASMLQRVDEDRLLRPQSPVSTLGREFRRLMHAPRGLVVSPSLVDRACPSDMSWQESRLDALYEIASAWPARLREQRDGTLHLLPPLPVSGITPKITLTDGENGTIISAKTSATRATIYNRIVARTNDSSDKARGAFQAVVDQEHGPYSTRGPFGIKTKIISSPLIINSETATNVAVEELRKNLFDAQKYPVTLPPDPTIWLDDSVRLAYSPYQGSTPVAVLGYVTAVEYPLTREATQTLEVSLYADPGINGGHVD